MITQQKLFGLYCCLLLVLSCVYAIYDPNDDSTKKGYYRSPAKSEPIVMHHGYRQVASNRPQDQVATQSTYDSTRQGRTSYTSDAQVQELKSSGQFPTNKTTIYYEKPIGTYDFTKHGSIRLPSRVLQPPKVPIEETTGRYKTNIDYAQNVRDYPIYYEKPSGVYDYTKQRSIQQPSTRRYETNTNLIQPVGRYKARELGTYTPPSLRLPNQVQSWSWNTVRKIPESYNNFYPTNNKPVYNTQRLPPRTFSPTSSPYDPNTTKGRLYPSSDANKSACQFDCQNGRCVSEYQVCDGVNNCGNRLDESNCEDKGFEVRLSNEEGKANMGRVEVKVRGQWGYVCDHKFGMRAADVLCKELGFVLGASEVRGKAYYPPDKQMYDRSGVRYLMDEVDCLGNETSINECKFMVWGVRNCFPAGVVGVECKIPVRCPTQTWPCKTSQECIDRSYLCDRVPDCQDASDESKEMCNKTIPFRIIGGPSEMEGRVEVNYRDTWGTICDDGFGKKEAQVICRTLGYLGEAFIQKNTYGEATGPIWLDRVSCIGNETTLEQCTSRKWGEHNCDHKQDVSVKCSERLAHPRAEPTTSTVKPEPVLPTSD